jgi:hypothetical protein
VARESQNIFFKRTKLIFSISLFCFYAISFSQTAFDSLKLKTPKHFFKTTILIDGYTKPQKSIKDTDVISKRLKNYGVNQFNFSFSTPIATVNRYNFDSTIHANTHYLLTANYTLVQPKFGGIRYHQLSRFGMGVRMIHNTGKRGLFFADVSPFVTTDNTVKGAAYWRMASTFLYSHLFGERFNFRIGLTKSFLWGNRYYLPYVGVRIGKLDGVNFSFQFPRNIQVQVPLSQQVRFNVFTKPQGGLFLFSNTDSLYFFKTDKQFYFTRYELITGFRFDFMPNEQLAFYVGFGLSTRNSFAFYSERANSKRRQEPLRKLFYEQSTVPTGFLNFGVSLKFGKNRSVYKNINLYEAIDLNNGIDSGDNGLTTPNSEIRKANLKKNQIKLNDVQDLIDYSDN